MYARALSALTLVLFAPLMLSARGPRMDDGGGVHYAQIIIRERMVIRIPRVDSAAAVPRPLDRAPPPPPAWRARRAPDCIAAASLVGAAMSGDDVDLLTADGRRLRATLAANCPTLDFYSGFYLKRTGDGMICARRDALRSRSGGRCQIARFTSLVARR